MIAWKQASDADDQGDCDREIGDGGDGEQPVNAERLLPHAAKKRREAGHDRAEEIEHTDGGGACVT